MGLARPVGRVFFPLDEELGLLPGNLAPRQQEHLVHLGSWMPFAQAARMLERLLGVQVSEEAVRRLTEHMGCYVETAQTAEAHAPWQEEPTGKKPAVRQAFSADGAYVPMVKGQWAEVRTVAIGEVEEQRTSDGTAEIHVGHLSYFSRLTDAATFTDLAEAEMRRRQMIQAERVCAVTDGADWLQLFIDIHRSDAVRILDFPHAAEHLAKLLEALEQAGKRFPSQMLERCLHVLKHRGPRPLLRMANRLPADLAEREGVREHLGYLRKREPLMQYPQFQEQGWPIGSGMVESANKLVVEARLKGAGMHWEPSHVNPMLALRNGVCNERWQEIWQVAVQQHRHQQAQRRQHRAAQRAQALTSPCDTLSPPPTSSHDEPKDIPSAMPPPPDMPSPPDVSPQPAAVRPVTPAATLPGSCRPSAHHPWKRAPACRPNTTVTLKECDSSRGSLLLCRLLSKGEPEKTFLIINAPG